MSIALGTVRSLGGPGIAWSQAWVGSMMTAAETEGFHRLWIHENLCRILKNQAVPISS